MDDTKQGGGIPRLSLTPEELAESAGVGRTAIFEAIRDKQLTAYKAGNRTTLIEVEEGRRWLRSLPWRGRPPESITAAA
jgi:excisionase family DNA binding protein